MLITAASRGFVRSAAGTGKLAAFRRAYAAVPPGRPAGAPVAGGPVGLGTNQATQPGAMPGPSPAVGTQTGGASTSNALIFGGVAVAGA